VKYFQNIFSMKNLLLLSAIFLLFFQACKKDEIPRPETLVCELETPGLYKTHPRSAHFQLLMDNYIAKGLPGIALLVKDNTGIFIGTSGMADIKEGIKLQPCHVSKVASINKMFMGVTLLRLQEKGVLSLDDPIDQYISGDILDKIENGREALTVRNLMNHTSGIYDVIEDQGFYLQIMNDPARHWTQEDLLEYVYGKPALFPFSPADTAGYSNTNYVLLSMIVEEATGKPHSQVLHEEVIDLLGLEDTYYFHHDELPEGMIAQGYYDLYNNGTLMNLSAWNTASGNGYGGLYSTVWDMYRFIDALFAKKTLLTQASLNQMLVFHPTVEARKHLGVSCYKDFIDIGDPEKDFAWGHRGRDLSYSADLFYFTEHEAIMSMIVNYGTDGESDLRPVFLEMRDEVAKLVVWEP